MKIVMTLSQEAFECNTTMNKEYIITAIEDGKVIPFEFGNKEVYINTAYISAIEFKEE